MSGTRTAALFSTICHPGAGSLAKTTARCPFTQSPANKCPPLQAPKGTTKAFTTKTYVSLIFDSFQDEETLLYKKFVISTQKKPEETPTGKANLAPASQFPVNEHHMLFSQQDSMLP